MSFIANPQPLGSYVPNDVIFLLKDIGDFVAEEGNEEREKQIQQGRHYSEMLPREYSPSKEYVDLFFESLNENSHRIALATGIVAHNILQETGKKNLVLVSLARAGTPVGVLIKRYIQQVYDLNLPHYSISIIRDKGIDENAVKYIMQQHPGCELQFIDGWTGKGIIARELTQSIDEFNSKYGTQINHKLAVLADPGYCANIFGTREDFLIPSACLNSTVSGLVSRTFFREDIIGKLDFHGAKYYKNLAAEDLSNVFIDAITKGFTEAKFEVEKAFKIDPFYGVDNAPNWTGMQEVEQIKQDFDIDNYNYIKPGVGETTRVLLRRIPWQILLKDMANPDLKHVLLLARERGVTLKEYPNMTYSCCGLIKRMDGSE